MTAKELEKLGRFRLFHFSAFAGDNDILEQFMMNPEGLVATKWEDAVVLTWPNGPMAKWQAYEVADHNARLMREHNRRVQKAKRAK
jgi:hypothetical protein